MHICRRNTNSPQVVALPDGSILVVGSGEWPPPLPHAPSLGASNQRTVERVRLNTEGQIVSEYVASVPAACLPTIDCRHETLGSFALIHIGNGRVMLAGGYDDRKTYLYDSDTGNWRQSAPMAKERSYFSLTLLPDGRVLVAGGDGENRDGDYSNRGMTTEVWDPKTELWSSGPKLPVPMHKHRSLLVNNKTVILAGGYFAGVLAWDIDQPQWRIAATLAHARADAGVSWLGNGKLVIVGGLHAADDRRIEGYSIIGIPAGAARSGKPAGLATEMHASATRGTQTLIAGGTLPGATFYGDAPTSNVELFDASSNTVRSMPALPFGALSAKAFWLDDTRVLIMALESDSHDKQLWADLFDTKTGVHKAIKRPIKFEIDPRDVSERYFSDMKIAGVHEDRVWLIFESQYFASLDFAHNTFLPVYRTHRSGFNSRVLNNGRIVVAGGQLAGAQRTFSRVANCEDCSPVYIEYGNILPNSTYEVFDPVEKKTITSAQSTALGGPLAILGDGRVAKLGTVTELAKDAGDTGSPLNKSLLLELSNAPGTHWHVLGLPPALRSAGDTVGLRLLGLLDSVLLIGIPNSNKNFDWWWIDVNSGTENWQALGSPRDVHAHAHAHGIHFGRLDLAGRTYALFEDDDSIAAFAE